MKARLGDAMSYANLPCVTGVTSVTNVTLVTAASVTDVTRDYGPVTSRCGVTLFTVWLSRSYARPCRDCSRVPAGGHCGGAGDDWRPCSPSQGTTGRAAPGALAGGPRLRRRKNAVVAARWRFSGDVVIPLMGRDLCVEVKARAAGFRKLYCWLAERDVLIVKADRQEPLVVLRLSLAAEIAKLGSAVLCFGKENGAPR